MKPGLGSIIHLFSRAEKSLPANTVLTGMANTNTDYETRHARFPPPYPPPEGEGAMSRCASFTLKPQNAPLLRGRAELAMCFNLPEKPALPEADLPVNTLQPDILAAGYQSLFRSPAFPWN